VSLAISNYVYSEKVIRILSWAQPDNSTHFSTFETCQLNAFMVLYRSALTGSLYAKTLRLTSMAARELGQVRSFHFHSHAVYILILT
jgi:hypothetical protein